MENSNNNSTVLKDRQLVKEVCPDGTNPLKYCYRYQCPFGYYCFYSICCKHLKQGKCPDNFPSAGVPAGPACDNDMECPWNFKCCIVNDYSRCVFPELYCGGTTT
uniref:WAP domain-containing protein n=1 Tax=Trichuris muris TaxID=70415 RepID=A0A5S6R106_TRIMR